MRSVAVVLVAVLALAGCGSKEPRLMNASANTARVGPDEFAVVPNRPLEMPRDMAALPPPTPGATNLADADPEGDAIAALGGRARTVRSDGALTTYTTRFGTDPGVRDALAEEDLAFRKSRRGKPLERMFRVNLYFEAYADFALDPYAELELLRARGIVVPVPPPAP